MNTTALSAEPTEHSEEAAPKHSASKESHSGAERRRRKRAKISAQVHLRAVDAPTPFEEVAMTVDVSRDGLQIAAARSGYWKGQPLTVTFPYSTGASTVNQAQPAEVMRVTQTPHGKFLIGIQFLTARTERRGERKSSDSASTEAHETQKSVVLAIEPDARSAENLHSMLAQDGYTVVTVSTAQEALDVLKTTVPAAFIAEVECDDISGHDLCLIVKRNERLRRVPVILLTRSAKPEDYTASHELGAVVCMAKPFKPERLQHVVRLVAPPPAFAVARP